VHPLKARDGTYQRVRFYAALGLVTAATLMLQIIETRIISVTSWYHLAFFVISIAMFGLTAGAVFVYWRTERFRPERLSHDLAVAALAFALATDFAILVQLTLVTGASPSLTSLVAWAEFALCLAVPSSAAAAPASPSGAPHLRPARRTCSPKIKFSFLNSNLMVPTGRLLMLRVSWQMP